jgi:hypothetical protein
MVDLMRPVGAGFPAARRAVVLLVFVLLAALVLVPGVALAVSPEETQLKAAAEFCEGARVEEVAAVAKLTTSLTQRKEVEQQRKEAFETAKKIYEGSKTESNLEQYDYYVSLYKEATALVLQVEGEQKAGVQLEDRASACERENLARGDEVKEVSVFSAVGKLETKIGERGYVEAKPLYVSGAAGSGGAVELKESQLALFNEDAATVHDDLWFLIGALLAVVATLILYLAIRARRS